MPFVALAVFMLAVAVLWAAVLVIFMARHLLRPRRMTETRALVRVGRMTPADLDLPFEPMGFTVRDARTGGPLRIAAWWMPTSPIVDRTVVVVHGYGDAKIGGIAWAPVWQSLGWNVLAVDLRAHGESEGRDCTAGFFERDDLDQVIDAMRAEKPAVTAAVALFGVSLGAACVAAVGARRPDLAAVVLESPYADYRNAVRAHVRQAGFPLVNATGAICRVAEWISKADFRVVRPELTVTQFAAPLLVICGDADPLIDIPAIKVACDARPKALVTRLDVWPGVPHVMALAVDPDRYRDTLASFLNDAGLGAAAATIYTTADATI